MTGNFLECVLIYGAESIIFSLLCLFLFGSLGGLCSGYHYGITRTFVSSLHYSQ